MKFTITRESNLEGSKSNIVQELSDSLNLYYKDKIYGEDINSFIVHLICVRPEFENFFKVRKPQYTDDKIEVIDGENYHIKKTYGYDIKLDYITFTRLSDLNSLKLLASEIISSLAYLDNMPKKVKDFDKEKFKRDLIEYFVMHQLIE